MKNVLYLLAFFFLGSASLAAQCSISNLTYDELLCENNGLIVFYGIDFDTMDVSSAFQIFIDGELQYSSFAYDLPIQGIEFDCPGSEQFDFKICDLGDAECCVEVVLDHPCFDICDGCSIYEFYNNTDLVCENDQMVAEWYIHSENTSEIGYDISLEGEFLTFVEYVDGSGPYFFDVPAVETEYFTLTACDSENPDCCFSWEALNPCFDEELPCSIAELYVEPLFCDDETFDVQVGFEYENTSATFEIIINDIVYGVYNYADLPINLLGIEVDCELQYEFVVLDSEDEDCSAIVGYEVACCQNLECDIFSIDFNTTPICENNQIVSEWFIFSENTSETGFDISINGDFLLFVEFDEEGPYIFDIPDPETELFTITACDNDNADCCYSWELENPCYEEPTECWISEVGAEVTVCEEELFDVEITFEYANTSDSFEIVGNGTNYGTFAYAALPIILTSLAADCELEYEFVINDSLDGDCTDAVELGIQCCDEQDIVENISISFPVEGDTTYILLLNIDQSQLSDCNVTVYVDGVLLGSYGSDEEIAVGPFACSDSSLVELLIVDSCTELEYSYIIDLNDYSCLTSIYEPVVEVHAEWNVHNSTLTVLTDTQEPLQIGIYATDGSLIKMLIHEGLQGSYPLEFDSQGIYFVSVVDNNGYRSTFKILSVR